MKLSENRSQRRIHFLFEWTENLKSGSTSLNPCIIQYFRVCHKTIVIIVNINDNCLLRHEILDENALHPPIWLLIKVWPRFSFSSGIEWDFGVHRPWSWAM